MDYYGDDLTRLIKQFVDALKNVTNKQLVLDNYLASYPYTKTRAILTRVYNAKRNEK